MRGLPCLLVLAAVLPRSARAEEAVVVADVAGDPTATHFLAELLVEEVRATGQLQARLGDPGPLRSCAAGRDVCLGLLATREGADVVYLTDVRRVGEEARVLLARYAVTVQGSVDGRALALRSRVRRFLSGRRAGRRGGGLLVRSTPTNAELLLDGELVGRTPRIVDGLFLGPHLVEVRRPGGGAGTQRTAMVAMDTLSEVVVAVEPEPGGWPAPGGKTLLAGGGAVVLALAGVALGLATSATQDELDALGEPTAVNVEQLVTLRDRGQQRALATNVAWGAAGAALLAAGWSYWQDLRAVAASSPPETVP